MSNIIWDIYRIIAIALIAREIDSSAFNYYFNHPEHLGSFLADDYGEVRWITWLAGDSLQVTISVLIDGGILVNANILRPNASLGFVMRNILCALAGVGLYILAIAFLMRLSVSLLHRRGLSKA